MTGGGWGGGGGSGADDRQCIAVNMTKDGLIFVTQSDFC